MVRSVTPDHSSVRTTANRPSARAVLTCVAGTYPGGRQVDDAQSTLDTHVVVLATGLCLGCGEPGPCPERVRAELVFRHSLRLPRRTPGASRPEIVGARRVGVPGWLHAG
jgi:hypothetical protein